MFSAGKKTIISIDEILNEVSEHSILEYYTGISKIPCVTNSPLRVDNNPSFGVFESDTGIGYKDYSTNKRGNLYQLLQQLFNLSFESLREKIYTDLDKIRAIDRYIIKKENKKNKVNRSKVSSKSLSVRIREYRDFDIKYWESFGISLKWLEFGRIYPISHFFIDGKQYLADKYAYCFVEYKDNIPTIKIYQPFNQKCKWLNNHDSSVWDLWQQAINSNYDKLIITSSRKDALCIWANTNIPAVALQSEGYLPKPHIVDILLNRFKEVYCLYDNDYDKEENYGRLYGQRLVSLYPQIKQIEIPDFYKSKDISDLFKNYNKNIVNQVINI